VSQPPPDLRRSRRFDFEEGGAGSFPQRWVRPSLNHAGSSDQSLQLIFGKTKGRQLCVTTKTIARTSLSLDSHAGFLEVSHIAVDRTNRYAKLFREPLRRRKAVTAQELDNLEKAVGTAHDQG